MDPLALLLETVIIPSFLVGAGWLGLLLLYRGHVPAPIAGLAQPLLMAVGFLAGIIGVLDRVPFPPSDAQGRLAVSALGIAVVFAGAGFSSWRIRWQLGLAVVSTAVGTWIMLPRTTASLDMGMAMALAALTVGTWAVSLQPPLSTGDGPAGVENPVAADGVLPKPAVSKPGAPSWVMDPFLLALGTACSVVILLGGSASYGQIAGVVCSTAGPFVVFGLMRKNWGLQPLACAFALALLVLLLVAGVRLASTHLAALVPLALAPVVVGSPTWLVRFGHRPLFWVGALLLSVVLLGAGVGLAVAFQPEESW